MEAFAPDLVAELEATAYGAARTLRELVFLQVRTELTYEGLCSAAAVRPPDTRGDGVLVGQNMDLDPSFRPFGLLIRRRLRDGPTILGFSWPGLVGYMGLNSAGLGLCVTQLVSPGWRVGVPAYFVSRRLLEQTSAGACQQVLAGVERGSSPNWLIADKTGTVIDVETTASHHLVLEPEGPIFSHTNHYLDPGLGSEDRLKDELPDSPARLCRLTELLTAAASAGGVDIGAFARSLRDHAGFPHSLCRHAAEVDGAMETVVSAVFDLDRRVMHVAAGPPCSANYTSLGVEDEQVSLVDGEASRPTRSPTRSTGSRGVS
jgi:isopenicillin-N N-acyltransferase-like protein